MPYTIEVVVVIVWIPGRGKVPAGLVNCPIVDAAIDANGGITN